MIYMHILMGNGMLKNTFENSSYLWDYKDTHKHIRTHVRKNGFFIASVVMGRFFGNVLK